MDELNQLCRCPELYWFDCYGSDSHYKKYITSESFAHPAKASFGLLNRIYGHLETLGLLQKEDTVVDFMAGSGRMNLVAALKGYRSIGVELEPHFIDMCNANREKLGKHLQRPVDWQIIQGDSRKLSEILQGQGYVGITSPPYQARVGQTSGEEHVGHLGSNSNYSSNPANIGNLKDRETKCPCHILPEHKLIDHPNFERLVGVVSPPYEEALTGGGQVEKEGYNQGHTQGRHCFKGGYSPNKDNIGNQQNESYLDAMKQVYAEAYHCGISPLVTITKNPTRKGQLRRLDLDTVRLLTSVGYKIYDYHRAVLFKTHKQSTLEGQVKEEYQGRLSFFKRLSLQKGNIASRWEDVIIAIRPEAN